MKLNVEQFQFSRIFSKSLNDDTGIRLKKISKIDKKNLLTKARAIMNILTNNKSEILFFDGKELKIKFTIRHLHFWARFVIKSKIKSLNLLKLFDKSMKMKINTNMILIFVDFVNNNIFNKIYSKKRAQVMLIEKSIHLKIFDKKRNTTAFEISKYQFIDILNQIISKNNV